MDQVRVIYTKTGQEAFMQDRRARALEILGLIRYADIEDVELTKEMKPKRSYKRRNMDSAGGDD